MIYKLPFNNQWHVFSDKDLLAMPPEESEPLREILRQYEENRLGFLLGHGPQMDFINNDKVDMGIVYAGNQMGKSLALICWLGRRMMPVHDYWHSCREHGLKPKEWTKPRKGAIASYIMTQQVQRMIWPVISEVWPMDELREYSAHWNPKDKRMKRKHPSWNSAPDLPLACGSRLDFFAYKQDQQAFESNPYDVWAFDEQVPEDQFDGAWARGTSIDDFQCATAMTPHYVKGRPDTGAHCWVTRMTGGLLDKGISWEKYHISLEDVPVALISESKRQKMYEKYILKPQEVGNQKKIREGRSRYYGLPESSEGLVYDNWDRSLQWIDPFEIPTGWTRFRGVDPGRKDVFGCICAAVAPWGDIVFYREYYNAGGGMEDNAVALIEACGNKRAEIDEDRDEYGNIRKIFEEIQQAEQYAFTVMDPRTFNSPGPQTVITQGQMFAAYGLMAIPGSGMHNRNAVPIVKEWFEPIPDRPHILERMKKIKAGTIMDVNGNPITGAPRLYIFNTLYRFRTEIESYCKKPGRDEPEDGNDHLMTAMKYLMLQNPRYDGEASGSQLALGAGAESGNEYTGYIRNGRVI